MDLKDIIAQIGLAKAQQNPVAPQIVPPDVATAGAAPQASPEMTLEQKVAAFNAINPSHTNLPMPHVGGQMSLFGRHGGASAPAPAQTMPPPESAPPTAAPMTQQGLAAPPPVDVVPAGASTGNSFAPSAADRYPVRKGAGLGTNLVAWMMSKAQQMQGPH